jgi:hypothetical protein
VLNPTIPRRRLRFTCACCKRRRGYTLLSGRWSKREPLCEDCALRIEQARKFTNEGGNKDNE